MENKISKHSILAKKLVQQGTLFQLASKGGEIVINEKFGLKINKKEKWCDVQLIIYDEPPTFKQNFGTTKIEKVYIEKPVIQKEIKNKEKDYVMKVESEENLFEFI